MIVKGRAVTQEQFLHFIQAAREDVIFEECDFEEVELEGAILTDGIVLSGCRFSEDFKLKSLKVGAEFRIYNCVFQKQLRIEGGSIEGNSYICKNTFLEDVHFSESVFSNNLILSNCVFHRYMSIRKCVFHEYAWMHQCEFDGYFSQLDAVFKRETFYEDCTFRRVNTFDRSKFARNVSFRQCRFLHAPTFFDVDVREGLQVKDCKFADFSSTDAIYGYRQIKQLFSNQKSKREEAVFYVFEQDAILKNQNGMIERIVVFLYKITSNYGTNLNRCIWTIFLINLVAILYYRFNFGEWGKAFDYLLAQLFSPFEIWKDKDRLPSELGLRVIATLQSLSVILNLLFLGLALGWRFKKE